MKRLAFLGPAGTFSEQAAIAWDPAAKLLPFATFSAVVSAVESGMADEGLVAFENALQGSVTDTADILIHETDLKITGELVLPIEHCLLVPPGLAADQVEVLFAHPQSLAQCRRFVERCFPKARIEAALSNSEAVQQALATKSAAAIGTRRAAEIYGAEILAAGIQDERHNVTRFVILAASDREPTGQDRTSLVISPEHVPGGLVRTLEAFSRRNINLTMIQSRPSKETLGTYLILLDLEGHRQDAAVAAAIEEVRRISRWMKVFGSYPRAAEPVRTE